jgi:anti-sigma regulatory factor (Ser/Thr protein kinase)
MGRRLEVKRSTFCHEVAFYDGADEFLAATVPFVRAALEAEEPALVAVGGGRTELLEGELGDDAMAVGFTDMEELGRNPARIIPVWREFLDRNGGTGQPVRGIGEPIWPGRSVAEIDECQRHESLLNVAFEGLPAWSLLCPYDSGGLDDEVLGAARACHPLLAGDGTCRRNPEFAGAGLPASPFGGELPPRPGESTALLFDPTTLHLARALVQREAEDAGLPRSRRDDLVTAVGELAANSVLHGGGGGTLRLWHEPDALVVEAEDLGHIEEPLAGRRRPTPTQEGGRGLWLVNQLCDLVQIRSNSGLTVIRLRMETALP